MTAAAALSGSLAHRLAALLAGRRIPWSELGLDRERFLAICADEDLTALVDRNLHDPGAAADWPAAIRYELARRSRAEIAAELVRQREVRAVLEVLAREGVHPLLLKGTPLAYTVYDSPSLRPRCDTDLMIPQSAVQATRDAMAGLGYAAPPYCDQLFRQFELTRQDEFGMVHVCDFHWKVSTQAIFADLLTYDELAADAIAIPALGPHARAAGPVHALLLACIHPAMHHQNVERLIWVYDIHLLAGRLGPGEFDRLADLALAKGVAAICARELDRARTRLGTGVPELVLRRLRAAGDEPSAQYLEPGRRWHDELVSNVRGLTRWSDRLRLLREVAFPSPAYMLRAYGLAAGPLGAALLPALYLHRGVRGVWKVIRGKK